MTHRDILNLKRGIEDCDPLNNPDTIDFTFGLALVDELISPYVKAIEKTKPKPTEEYKKYLEATNELIQKYAAKDEKGNYIPSGKGIMLSNTAEYNRELSILNKRHEKTIKEQEDAEAKYDIYLDSDFDKTIPIPKLKKEFIPKGITVQQMRGIIAAIER